MSRLPHESWIEGKRVAVVRWRPFEDGRGGTTYNPVLHFEDGSILTFVAEETDVGEYGVRPVYVPSTKRRK